MLGEIKDKIKFSYLNELKEKDFFSTLDIFFANYLECEKENSAIFLAYLFLISRFGFISLEIKDDNTIYPSLEDLNLDTKDLIDIDVFVKKVILGSKNLSETILYLEDNTDENYPKKPICRFKNFYYLQKNYVFEKKIIKNLKRLENQSPTQIFDEDIFFKTLKNENFLNLEQKKAVENVFFNSISLILGGPGTGKTYVASYLVDILSNSLDRSKKDNFKIAITSFTGKATSHLKSNILKTANNIDLDAKTLHLLLKLKEGKPKVFDEKKLNYDLIIVDEASMLDLKLTAHLLNSIKNGSRVIFIGDPNQLPPIESGNVFAEISTIENIEKVHLKHAKRFENSKIIDLANAIKNTDEKALDEIFSKSDFYDIENISKAKKIILDMAQNNFLESTSKDMQIEDFFSKLKDFIILSSIKKGPFGVDTLNQEIFSLLYNKADLNDYLFVPIIITKNNYNLNLFNGEFGILKIQKTLDGPSKKEAYFKIDDKIQKFEIFYLNSYEYAYSISIHKSQGSEFKNVAIIIPTGSENFGKELFYTALTRSKNEFSIFSTKKILKDLIKVSSFKKSALSI
ncbi:MAG: RecBCD enzyme subunit RecD [Candidatus Anoxychlamydiales bacterium]|nr:RecBCD enzyme subunit RecD [Candidatus Anoxychlamydiales bacterium]NGX40505.1 RecBCD enzyme subunit RecD [Candidatus Anoxychlamydiales bacterium]